MRADKQSFLALLLSHHPAERLHLCYPLRVGSRRIHLCARCLGLFPATALTLVIGSVTGPWPWWLEWTLLFLPPLPAFLDWGTSAGAGKPERSNHVRLLGGVGLGVGLGASLHINTYALASYPVMAQFVFFIASVWLVWMVSYARRSRLRRERLRERVARRPTLEEYIKRSIGADDQESGGKR